MPTSRHVGGARLDTGNVLLARRSVTIEDPEAGDELGARTAAFVPVAAPGGALGVIAAADPLDGRQFDERRPGRAGPVRRAVRAGAGGEPWARGRAAPGRGGGASGGGRAARPGAARDDRCGSSRRRRRNGAGLPASCTMSSVSIWPPCCWACGWSSRRALRTRQARRWPSWSRRSTRRSRSCARWPSNCARPRSTTLGWCPRSNG